MRTAICLVAIVLTRFENVNIDRGVFLFVLIISAFSFFLDMVYLILNLRDKSNN